MEMKKSMYYIKLIVLLSCLFLLFPLSQTLSLAPQCIEDQRLTLLQLKHQLLPNDCSKMVSWTTPNTDCCSWGGISCNKVTGQVTGLDLSSCKFPGNIDSNSSLFHLHSLQSLNLSYTSFSSFGSDGGINIPSGFARLSNLTHLDLAHSYFSGQIPLEISYLTRLMSLDLSYTSLKLENPNMKMLIRSMSGLRELRLDGVQMSMHYSGWSQDLSSLRNLSVLRLSGCSISGPIHSSFSNLHYLTELDLSYNNLSCQVPDFFANFTSLTYINLALCELYGEFHPNIFKLPNLRNLIIHFNPLLGGYLPEFPKHNALQLLFLSSTKFVGKLPGSIGNLKSLTYLLLDECNFSGSIPSSLASLTQLISLDLSSNNFSGSIPSLSSLMKLEYLNFQNNSFNGVMDYSIFSLLSLQVLRLGHNRLHGPYSDILNVSSSSLRLLDLSNNGLYGPFPKLIFQLKSLQKLYLYSNNFNGTLDLNMLSGLVNLSRIDLSDNQWLIIPSPNSTFPNLESVQLHSCNIAEFPNFLRNLEGLRLLDLSNNKIQGQIPNWIWKRYLNYLNLSHNLLTGLDQFLPDVYSGQLVYLDLHSNRLHGSIPIVSGFAAFLDYSNNEFTSRLQNDIGWYLYNATFFSVSGNKLIGEIPPSICRASYLQVLDMSNNSFSGTIPKCLGEFSDSLIVLNLGGNDIHGSMPQTYSRSLKTLVFNGNQLEGTVPRSLSNCEMLEILDLGNNQISDAFPFWLENLVQLQVIVLRSNRFYGPFPQPQTKNAFPMLHVIDLSSNNFTGNLPMRYFQSWKAMMKVGDEKIQVRYTGSKYYHDAVTMTIKGQDMVLVKILNIFACIDLSNNGLEGEIPELIGDLKSLIVLNLSRNNLDGLMPSSLGYLKELESLDLSQNMLTGGIPWQLTSLTFLSNLNLSKNQLVGIIPRGRQFETFSNASYEGNSGLCGFPLSRKCSIIEVPPPKHLESESKTEFDWVIALIGYGCGTIAGLVIGHFLIWRNDGYFTSAFTGTKRRSTQANRLKNGRNQGRRT